MSVYLTVVFQSHYEAGLNEASVAHNAFIGRTLLGRVEVLLKGLSWRSCSLLFVFTPVLSLPKDEQRPVSSDRQVLCVYVHVQVNNNVAGEPRWNLEEMQYIPIPVTHSQLQCTPPFFFFFPPDISFSSFPPVEKCMSSMQLGTQMVKLRGGSKGLVRFFFLDEHKSCIRWRPSRKNEKAKSEFLLLNVTMFNIYLQFYMLSFPPSVEN